MSDKVGNMSYYDSSGQSEMSLGKPNSEETAELIDKEVKRLMEEAFATATRVLTEHREGFTQLAELLLEKEVSSRRSGANLRQAHQDLKQESEEKRKAEASAQQPPRRRRAQSRPQRSPRPDRQRLPLRSNRIPPRRQPIRGIVTVTGWASIPVRTTIQDKRPHPFRCGRFSFMWGVRRYGR